MKSITLLAVFSFVFATAAAQIPPPYSQDFEGATFPPAGWQTFPIGSPINWVRDTTVSGYGTGTACTSFDNYNTAAGSYYGIRLPSMNFSGVTAPYIRFDIAYAMRTGSASDVFGIWWSNNGTSNWQNVINYSGNALITAPSTTALFIPTIAQWETKTLSLASLAGLPFVRLAIEDDCNHGNKIYFDNVLVFDSATVGIEEIYNSNDLARYPNPFRDFLTVHFQSGRKLSSVELFNIAGARLASAHSEKAELRLEGLSSLSAGVYFLKATSADGKTVYNKVLKQ